MRKIKIEYSNQTTKQKKAIKIFKNKNQVLRDHLWWKDLSDIAFFQIKLDLQEKI